MMKNWSDEKIIDEVLAEFSYLAEIPRPSGHEEKVGEYLLKRFAELGAAVGRDKTGNVIAEIPASADGANKPRVIVQSHMDMVCVSAPGVKFDPLNDPIKLIRTAETLTADGTSLGSDDGIGIASILYLFAHKDEFTHGPLRAIITVDEEVNMTGAAGLDAKYLVDAAYLINCDSENVNELTIGSAGNIALEFARQLTVNSDIALGAPYQITVKGLKGGHSGECINLGRANALKVLAVFLADLVATGVDFSLSEFVGGVARNAIPTESSAIIVSEANFAELENIAAKATEKLKLLYGDADPDAVITVQKTAMPKTTVSADDALALIKLLTIFHTGVYAMSPVVNGLVETSANLGQVIWSDESVRAVWLARSSKDEKLKELRLAAALLADATGWQLKPAEPSPGWAPNPSSRLAKITSEVFAEQNGYEMKIQAIHAGLECGFHAQKNPAFNIVSIGVTTRDIHSSQETLELATVPIEVKLIAGTIERL